MKLCCLFFQFLESNVRFITTAGMMFLDVPNLFIYFGNVPIQNYWERGELLVMVGENLEIA